MLTVNELKYAALKFEGAVGNTMSDLEYDWLKVIQGLSGKTLNELWISEFISVGATPAPWNSMAFQFLGIQGATAKTLSGRWYQFWLLLAP